MILGFGQLHELNENVIFYSQQIQRELFPKLFCLIW